MAKQYTAQEILNAAIGFDVDADDCVVCVGPSGCENHFVQHFRSSDISAMLRQAAEMMEREEREKKYEYKVLYRHNGYLYDSIRHYQNIQSAQKTLGLYSGHEDAHIVRRSVGEWEEVE